jgi:molybdopterin converting factor small subunit
MSTDARVSVVEQALAELAAHVDRVTTNIDQLGARIDQVNANLGARIDQVNANLGARIDHVNANVGARIDQVNANLGARIDQVNANLGIRLEQVGARIDRATAVAERASAEVALLSAEMRDFKVEMAAFKQYVLEDIAESRAGRAEDRKKWGELANSMGTLVEDIVAPGIPDVFQRVFGVSEVIGRLINPKVPRRGSGPSREFDAVAWGGGYFLLNETKRRVKPEDIPAVVALLPEVRDYFPQAEGLKVVGSVASFRVDASMVRAAEREGLLVFGLGGGLLEVLNSAGFKPREF